LSEIAAARLDEWAKRCFDSAPEHFVLPVAEHLSAEQAVLETPSLSMVGAVEIEETICHHDRTLGIARLSEVLSAEGITNLSPLMELDGGSLVSAHQLRLDS